MIYAFALCAAIGGGLRAAHAASAGEASASITVTVDPVSADTPNVTNPPPVADLSQTITVTIAPGPFTITPSDAVAHLHRRGRGRRFTGTLGPVRVTDARGSLAGWVARVALADRSNSRLSVTPSLAVAVTGRPGEAQGGRRALLVAGHSVDLMSAAADGGGGIVEIGASLDLANGPASGPDTIDVPIHLSLT